MEDIARRAGLAEGTVYRHFPTKADLVRALVADQVQDLCVRADTALTQQDAGAGLYGFLHEAADAHAGDRGFRDVVAAHYSEDDRPLGGGADAAGVPEALTDLVDRLTRRAQDAGALRPDVTATDLLQMIAALPDREPSRTTHLIVLLDGLRTLPATS
jgi:AcrR family transcriptional regulator